MFFLKKVQKVVDLETKYFHSDKEKEEDEEQEEEEEYSVVTSEELGVARVPAQTSRFDKAHQSGRSLSQHDCAPSNVFVSELMSDRGSSFDSIWTPTAPQGAVWTLSGGVAAQRWRPFSSPRVTTQKHFVSWRQCWSMALVCLCKGVQHKGRVTAEVRLLDVSSGKGNQDHLIDFQGVR